MTPIFLKASAKAAVFCTASVSAIFALGYTTGWFGPFAALALFVLSFSAYSGAVAVKEADQ
ncbi:hypothetical protein CN090_04195 [Sinorhizobium meliloti]|uniref:hypothetical protein n=1 Tax=Rhizobium meliloti TaxID=382 RepID=UPI000FD7CCF6|nr:hypothetical protein [Sinorhizobium meliloti]RVO55126.1 hypothetical protein CN090_04195 [Sinorhizobium meliloti]